jgi:AcrR family transcriptional regulator
MAPYNHFADKAALIATAAAEGFRRLKLAMTRRMSDFAPGDPRRLQAVGVAYVVFAVENAELFRLMFGPELADATRHQELRDAAGDVHRTLLGAMGMAGVGASAPAAQVALTPWALVHGLAMLMITGQIPARSSTEVEALAGDATHLLFVGLKNWPVRRP